MEHKKPVIITAVIIVVVIAIIFLFQGDNDIFNISDIIHPQGDPIYDYTDGVNVSQIKYMPTVYNNITGDYRPEYPEMSVGDYEWIFGNLPEFRQDFFSIIELVQEGKITDYARLSSNYWKQPEFYVGWFGSINTYLNNDPNTWITEGYGCYPVIKQGESSPGEDIVVTTYFKTGFATESYQGLILRPYFPDSALSLRGNKIFDNPEDVEDYLTISITNSDDPIYNTFKDDIQFNNVGENDWMVILKPTYKEIFDIYGEFERYTGFPSDWVSLLNISINIADDTPVGDYVVAIKINQPCFDINQEYYFSTEHDYYGKSYVPGGKIYKTLIPHFQMILHIE